MHAVRQVRLKIVGAIMVTMMLAACGGGGDGHDSPPMAYSDTNSPDDDRVGLIGQRAPEVPAAYVILNAVPASTYAGQAHLAWASVQDWRGRMRSTERGLRGVGYWVQSTVLDNLATTLLTQAERRADANTLLTAAGYPVAGYATASVAGLSIEPGSLCVKRLFSALPGVELLASGMGAVGLAVPEDHAGECVVVAGLPRMGAWQLPPTGSTAVYPFPGKTMLLADYSGDPVQVGEAANAQLGHGVYVSVASVDALPTDIPGAGTGRAIDPAQITLETFTLRVKGSMTTVPAKVLIYPGMRLGPGVVAQTSPVLRFPTSIMLIPSARLTANTVWVASFAATVNGRRVYRNWEFTTAS